MANKVNPPIFPQILPRDLEGVLSTYPIATREMLNAFREYARVLNLLTTRIMFGSGSPEGVVEAPVGTLYLRDDGSPGSTLYSKESGVGAVGWRAK